MCEKIFIALPVLREFDNIKHIISLISNQTFKNLELVICINQPNSWWNNPERIQDCLDNKKSLYYCNSLKDYPITTIDKSSNGNGWSEKKKGVGQARKTIFDHICNKADDNDLIISIDADTTFSNCFIETIVQQFTHFPKSIGMAIPYHHPLGDDDKINRAILQYEIYMRYYLINLLRINSPYAFTALGSSMAFPVWAYKKVNGITALEAGEDFYFLQKLAKTGTLLLWNSEKTFPAVRLSNRVPFGTGPAIQKGICGNWDSFPIYNYTTFNSIEKTYNIFPSLFLEELETPITSFLKKQLKTSSIWEPLRKNFKTKELFIKACHNRFDGLRILQFLKQHHNPSENNEENLIHFINAYYQSEQFHISPSFSFKNSPITEINQVRLFLETIELNLRYAKDYEI